MLIGAHRAWIDIEIRVEFPDPHAIAARLAAIRPLPSEETTPPVINMYRAMGVEP